MHPSPEIFNELNEISPLLAGLEKIQVFTVPEGYFDELHLRVANFAILNHTSAVDNINKRNMQQVPAGYFDTLPGSILAKVKAAYPETAAEELQRISPKLAGLKSNVFSVPEGYFEAFAGTLFDRLTQANITESADGELQRISPVLSALKSNVFTVPEGYFESLPGQVLAQLNPALDTENAEEELRRLSPMLYAIKDNVFSVPEGYFEALSGEVMQKLKPQPARVITMKKRTSWLRYAAAAVVTGAIAISSLQIFNSSRNSNTEKLPEYITASFQYKTDDDLNAGIAKLSDDDIIKYLEKNGNIMDNELLTNNTDVSEMPSQDDYLNDENTLNQYLDKIDAPGNKSNP